MKTWIVIAVVGLSVLAIWLLVSTTFAYAFRQQPSQQYGQYWSTSVLGWGRGMMNGGTWGETMGNGRLTSADFFLLSNLQHGSGMKGNGRCASAVG